MDNNIALLRQWLEESVRTVVFSGAGVSTASGLSDFRGSSGLYNQTSPYGCPPDRILSHEFYTNRTRDFFDYYRTKLLDLTALPNFVHYALAEMEHQGHLNCIITQNADGLHQRAGSKNVIDLHGNVYRNTCDRCGKTFGPARTAQTPGIPYCECGGIIRPGIVLFDEVPDMANVFAAVKELNQAELILIAGSSMRLASTTKLFNSAKKARIAVLNDGPTAFDERADLIVRGDLSNIFRQLQIAG